MALGSAEPPAEMSSRNLFRDKARPVLKVDNYIAIFDPTVYKMLEPPRPVTEIALLFYT
jgi:hypothetical protein